MSQIRRFFCIAAIITALAIISAAQLPVDPTSPKKLTNGEKCTSADTNGCLCGDKPTAVGCECMISSVGGPSTVSCPPSGPGWVPTGLLILVGGIIGSGLTYVIMRRRVKP